MAQQNLDFNIVAHTKGMEAIASLINRVGALETEIKKVQQANAGLAASSDAVVRNGVRYNNAMDAQSKALRNTRMGTQQLGMQINDFATSVSTGASPIQAFNQQLGQLGFAMSMMGGTAGRIGAFLAGPWGAAITIATMVLGPFIARLFDTEEAADRTEEALQGLIDKQNQLEASQTQYGDAQRRLNSLRTEEADLLAEIQRLSRGRVVGGIPEFAYREHQQLLALQERIRNAQRAIWGETVRRRGDVLERQRAAAAREAAQADSEAAKSARELARSVSEQNQELERARSALRLVVDPVKQYQERLTSLSNAIGSGIITAEEFRSTVRDALGVPQNAEALRTTQIEAWTRSLNAGLVTAQEFNDWLISLPPLAGSAAEALKAINAELAAANPAPSWEDFALPDSFVQDAIKKGEEIRDGIRGYTDEMKQSFDAVGQSVDNAFKGMLTGAMGWKEAMRGIIQSVIDQLWKMYVTQQIVGFVTGALKSIGVALPKRAAGGSVNARTPYMVGEKGPELFIPGGNGTIIPNKNVGGGSSGNVISINVDARGATDAAAVRAQVQRGILEAAPSIIAAAQQKTVSDMRRPRLGGVMQ